MTDSTDKHGSFERDEVVTARLIKLAGPGETIPDDVQQRVYERVRSEWQTASAAPHGERVYRKVRREWRKGRLSGRRFRWALTATVAATMVLAAIVVLQQPPTVQPVAGVGTVVKVINTSRRDSLPAVGYQIHPGDSLSTLPGEGVSMRLTTDESLRLDQNSTLIVTSGHEFELIRGRLYVDSGDRVYRDQGVIIDTPLGTVTDIGTQFIVASSDDLLEVAVREGRVDIAGETEELIAVAGERLRLPQHGQAVTGALEPHDEYWVWATDLAASFDIENRTLLDFLRWAARETGRELVFEDNELRMAAMRTDLHGSVAGFKPLEAIESVMTTTSFRYRIEPTRIVITR